MGVIQMGDRDLEDGPTDCGAIASSACRPPPRLGQVEYGRYGTISVIGAQIMCLIVGL
jgi:hypothetical protein